MVRTPVSVRASVGKFKLTVPKLKDETCSVGRGGKEIIFRTGISYIKKKRERENFHTLNCQ